jgi:hypothetical protein
MLEALLHQTSHHCLSSVRTRVIVRAARHGKLGERCSDLPGMASSRVTTRVVK